MKITLSHSVLELVIGDITQEETDAIVNAANTSLLGGGGVDGAIHRAGGPQILEECKRIGRCPAGESRLTSGGRLKARYVIHTVGPVYQDGRHGEPEVLTSAYRSSLLLALKHGIRTLSFPSISTGAYRYPVQDAARIALKTAMEFLEEHQGIETVRFVLFDERTYSQYETSLKDLIAHEHSGNP